VKKATRKYTRKEDSSAAIVAAANNQTLPTSVRGAGSAGRAKKRRATGAGAGVPRGGPLDSLETMGARTIVASNPFDDDQPIPVSNQHQINQHPPPMHLMPASSPMGPIGSSAGPPPHAHSPAMMGAPHGQSPQQHAMHGQPQHLPGPPPYGAGGGHSPVQQSGPMLHGPYTATPPPHALQSARMSPMPPPGPPHHNAHAAAHPHPNSLAQSHAHPHSHSHSHSHSHAHQHSLPHSPAQAPPPPQPHPNQRYFAPAPPPPAYMSPPPAGPQQPNQSQALQGPPPQPQPQPQQQHQQQAPPQQQPIVAYCAECRQPVYAAEPKIACRAGCESYYHRHCSGLTELACDLLLREQSAEWACNRCICSERKIPIVRSIHSQSQSQAQSQAQPAQQLQHQQHPQHPQNAAHNSQPLANSHLPAGQPHYASNSLAGPTMSTTGPQPHQLAAAYQPQTYGQPPLPPAGPPHHQKQQALWL